MDDKQKILRELELNNCEGYEAKQHYLNEEWRKFWKSNLAENPQLAKYCKKKAKEREYLEMKAQAKCDFWFYLIISIICITTAIFIIIHLIK